jgi:ferredoxin--NADP+ reductase
MHCLASPFTRRLPFTAGQFAKLGLDVDGERVQRAYSYVNAPGNPDLEFYLVTVPEGKLSPRLAALKPGDEVQVVSEAAGFFVLEEVPDCDTLWMLATGTAIGPYLSILEEGKDLDRFKNLVLVHAARYAADSAICRRCRRWKRAMRASCASSRS